MSQFYSATVQHYSYREDGLLDGAIDDGFPAICFPLLEETRHNVHRPIKGRLARHDGNRRTDSLCSYTSDQKDMSSMILETCQYEWPGVSLRG